VTVRNGVGGLFFPAYCARFLVGPSRQQFWARRSFQTVSCGSQRVRSGQVQGGIRTTAGGLPFCSHERAHTADTCCSTCPVMPQHAGVSFQTLCTMRWATAPGQSAISALQLSRQCLLVVSIVYLWSWYTLFWALIRLPRHALFGVVSQSCVHAGVCHWQVPTVFEALEGCTMPCGVSFGCDRDNQCNGNTVDRFLVWHAVNLRQGVGFGRAVRSIVRNSRGGTSRAEIQTPHNTSQASAAAAALPGCTHNQQEGAEGSTQQ
jgi:hypothetical protein